MPLGVVHGRRLWVFFYANVHGVARDFVGASDG